MISCKCIEKNYFGNQLFQFCSGLGISKKLGFDFKIAKKSEPVRLGSSRLEECFDIPSKFLTESIEIIHTYKEKKIGFDPNVYTIKDNTDLSGWFQSPKYFFDLKEEIFEILKFKQELLIKANQIWDSLDLKKPSVSIHVRRGDYIQSALHPVCDKEYYEEAKELFPDHNFFVFSDDPNWCEENMKEPVVHSGNDLIDFILMSKCNNHIIANSTFSWWAAWLNKSENKTIVAPQKWFKDSNKFYTFKDIYCESWIVI